MAFLAGRAAAVGFARVALRRPRSRERDRHSERWLLALKVYEGTAWGVLLWIGLPVSIPAISILLMSLMGAVCGNGVSLLAPLRYLYLSLALPMLTLAFATLWSMGGVSYRALAVCCILYIAGQYGQVRIANGRVREGIALRFENLSLVDQLRAETEDARAARRQAEDADAAKSHFLAAASHDLRQPVHALGLFLHALGHTRLEPAQRRMVESAQAASIASSDMLNTLLDFSRIEAGVVVARPAAFALQPLLDKLENELAPMADAKRLIYRCPPTPFVVLSDAALLELVLRNLILNAIRYTDRGGLLIACRRRDGGVSIEVHDTGIGIAPEQQTEVFSEFHQLGNPERDRTKGLGLGLAIVQGLAATLEHPLSLSSVKTRGSVFRIRVPLVAAGSGCPFPEVRGTAHLAGASILVIDDDPIVRDAMLHLLASWGCRARAADGLDEAVAQLRHHVPDLVICDYRLREDQTGAGIIAALRGRFGDAFAALLITGDTAPERLKEAAHTGIPLLHKPVSPEDLSRRIASLLGRPVRPPA